MFLSFHFIVWPKIVVSCNFTRIPSPTFFFAHVLCKFYVISLFLQGLEGGWRKHYNFRCQPVDYSTNPSAIRVIYIHKMLIFCHFVANILMLFIWWIYVNRLYTIHRYIMWQEFVITNLFHLLCVNSHKIVQFYSISLFFSLFMSSLKYRWLVLYGYITWQKLLNC